MRHRLLFVSELIRWTSVRLEWGTAGNFTEAIGRAYTAVVDQADESIMPKWLGPYTSFPTVDDLEWEWEWYFYDPLLNYKDFEQWGEVWANTKMLPRATLASKLRVLQRATNNVKIRHIFNVNHVDALTRWRAWQISLFLWSLPNTDDEIRASTLSRREPVWNTDFA